MFPTRLQRPGPKPESDLLLGDLEGLGYHVEFRNRVPAGFQLQQWWRVACSRVSFLRGAPEKQAV